MPTSDAGSVVHAYQLRPGDAGSLQGLPGYNGGTPRGKLKRPPPQPHPRANGVPPHAPRSPANHRTDNGAQPQAPHRAATPTASTLTRKGGVSITVPPQSQAGSLV